LGKSVKCRFRPVLELTNLEMDGHGTGKTGRNSHAEQPSSQATFPNPAESAFNWLTGASGPGSTGACDALSAVVPSLERPSNTAFSRQ
jgi:hypothetical protein